MADNDDDNQNEERVSLSPDDLKALREKAKRADELERINAENARKLAFVEAKIDVTDPKLSYFVKGYDGELNADAIRAEAQKAGFITAAPSAPQVPQEELLGHQKVGAAATGADGTEPFNFHDELAKCKSPEEVMALAQRQNMPTVWNRSA